MKKLLDGIRDFHVRVRPGYRERFAHLALGQSPDCLFVACSDSRVVPNLFASTDPGDLFVLRNVGNVVPVAGAGDASAGAAVEFATLGLGVRDIVVCGHSSCGAMRALLTGERPDPSPSLDRWLEQARPSLGRLRREEALAPSLPDVDRLSQAHVLEQIDHLRGYVPVAERLAAGTLNLHAWWFDLANAEVLAFDADKRVFLPLVR
ncbi:MAG: carbonic anhydrase [Myxococcota bacterium]